MQLANFGRHNHTATAAKHLDVFAASLAQQIDHVLEILHMTALVGADGNALCVLLQCSRDHFIDRPVVTQVNHLGAHALQDAAHDVDGRVMAIKQTGGRHKAHFVGGAIFGKGFVFGRQVGHGKFPVKDQKGRIKGRPSLIDVYVNVNSRS